MNLKKWTPQKNFLTVANEYNDNLDDIQANASLFQRITLDPSTPFLDQLVALAPKTGTVFCRLNNQPDLPSGYVYGFATAHFHGQEIFVQITPASSSNKSKKNFRNNALTWLGWSDF